MLRNEVGVLPSIRESVEPSFHLYEPTCLYHIREETPGMLAAVTCAEVRYPLFSLAISHNVFVASPPLCTTMPNIVKF